MTRNYIEKNKLENLNISKEVLSKAKIYKKDNKDYFDISEINQIIISNRKLKYETDSKFCCKRELHKNNINVIDLFCGAGGSSAGFKLAGFSLVGAIDINEKAAKTHSVNFPECNTIIDDITTLKPEDFHKKINNVKVDVIIGSPPCQTFSSLSEGKIKSLGKDIKKDVRNYFYKYYLDYVEYFKPKIFLMENVPGFKTKYSSRIFNDFLKYIKDNLKEYNVKYDTLDSKSYSVPQSRKRFFVCGYRKELNFDFPIKNNMLCENNIDYISVEKALSDLPIIDDNWRIDECYYSCKPMNKYQKFMRLGNNDTVNNNFCRLSNKHAKELFCYLKPGEKYEDLDNTIKRKIKLFDNFESNIIKSRVKRLPLNDVSWTIIAHIGMDGYEYVHPKYQRTLSVREAARLQSFPDDFVFVGNMREQYVQIGNAVPPILSYSIAKEIEKTINNFTKKHK